MLSNLKVFTDKVYKKMKRLIEETDDHDLQDLKQAFKAHNNKYVLHFSSLPLFSLPTKPHTHKPVPDNQHPKHLKR